MSVITEVQISNYIESLNIREGTDLHALFERLLLIDSVLFKDCMERLISGEIDTVNLMALSSITDQSIQEYFLTLDTGDINATSKRDEYISILGDDFNFKAMKIESLDQFRLYIHKKFLDNSNWGIKVSVDPLGLAPDSYLSFSHAKEKYLGLLRSDAIINQKYQSFLTTHDTFQYKINLVKDLIDQAMNEAIFIDNMLNPKSFTRQPIYRFILSEAYKYVSPTTFNEYYKQVLGQMVSNYDAEITIPRTGWPTITDEISSKGWDLNQSSSLEIDFTKVQLIRYWYPKMYETGGIDVTPIINVAQEKLILDEFIVYFDKAREVLQDIVTKTKIGI